MTSVMPYLPSNESGPARWRARFVLSWLLPANVVAGICPEAVWIRRRSGEDDRQQRAQSPHPEQAQDERGDRHSVRALVLDLDPDRLLVVLRQVAHLLPAPAGCRL